MGRNAVSSRWQRAGDHVMLSVPSTTRRLRAVGNLGIALVSGLAGFSLVHSHAGGTPVHVAAAVLLALGALALAVAVSGLRG